MNGDKMEYLDKNSTDIQQIIKINLDKGEVMSYNFSDKVEYNNTEEYYVILSL